MLGAFQSILEAAEQCNLHVRPAKKSVYLTPPKKRNVALVTVWPKAGRFDIGVWAESITKFYNLDLDHIQNVVGWTRMRQLDEDEVPGFVSRLLRLFDGGTGSDSED